MNIRTTFILLAALILVAGYLLLEDSPGSEDAVGVGQDAPWFYTTSMDDIERIAVAAGSQEAAFIYQGVSGWFFAEPQGPPVDIARWGGITLLLGGPQTKRVVRDTVDDPSLFGLDDPSITIDVSLTGDRSFKLLLGATTPDGTYHYAQREGDDSLYLVDALWGQVISGLAINPPFPPWYYKVPVQRVRFLSISQGEEMVEFTRDFNRVWRFADQERTPVDEERWREVLPILGGPPSLRILQTRIDDLASYGLLEPVTRITVEVDPPPGIEEPRRPIEMEIGSQLDDGSGYYTKVVGQPYLLFIDADWHDAVLQLLQDPPVGVETPSS